MTPPKRMPYIARKHIEDALRDLSKLENIVMERHENSNDPDEMHRLMDEVTIIHRIIYQVGSIGTEER